MGFGKREKNACSTFDLQQLLAKQQFVDQAGANVLVLCAKEAKDAQENAYLRAKGHKQAITANAVIEQETAGN